MTQRQPITVFYDGACGVCSTEIAHYMRKADARVRFIDIASPDFDATAHGRTMSDFQREMHVRDAEGRYRTGVAAFRLLWDNLPSPFYPLLSTLVGLPGIHLAARAGYAAFARVRRFLPGPRAAYCPLPGQYDKAGRIADSQRTR